MPQLVWWLLALAVLAAMYLFLIAPSRTRPDAAALSGKLYAHRGLHDGNHTVFENSMEAFRRAADAGYGIELDVQLTLDGALVVHHDGDTARVCGVPAAIGQTHYDALPRLPDGSPVPLLADVLALVAGRVPLIVEIKPYGSPEANAAAALSLLKDYRGPYCVESFHPMAVRYFRKTAPGIVRGQLAMGGRRDPAEAGVAVHIALKYLLVNALARPHFVAYQSASDQNLSMWLMKRLFRPLLVAWTLRSQPALDRARKAYQMNIFELFTPDAPPQPSGTGRA